MLNLVAGCKVYARPHGNGAGIQASRYFAYETALTRTTEVNKGVDGDFFEKRERMPSRWIVYGRSLAVL
jgi:hypothetical protein